jgi:hypothetical protein
MLFTNKIVEKNAVGGGVRFQSISSGDDKESKNEYS